MSDNTKLQANFKLADGTLINVYGEHATEFESHLNSVLDLVGKIHSVSGALANFTRGSNLDAALRNELGATVVDVTPAPAAPAPAQSFGANSCRHGAMIFRESKPGAAKAWKGYFCPSPKGTPDQCEPKFVR